MQVRKRSRVTNRFAGSSTDIFGNNPVERSVTFYEQMTDTIGNKSPQGFFHPNGLDSMSTRVESFPTLNHIKSTVFGKQVWTNYPCELVWNGLFHLPVPITPPGALLNRALAGSGPSNPRVNLPLSLFELREIPRMLKHAGDFLHNLRKKPLKNATPSEIASATLAYQFGWAPIIDDVQKLLDFQATTKKRASFLRKLSSGKPVRARIGLGEVSNFRERKLRFTIAAALGTMGTETVRTTMSNWATVSWIARDGGRALSAMNVDELNSHAFRSAFGLNLGHIPIAIWKALPWTWLIDWFANISDMLQATYNLVSFEAARVCVMAKTVTTYEIVSDDPSKISDGKATVKSMSRIAYLKPAPQSPLRLPIMDDFKASILGSLAVLRIRRSAR